MNKKKELKLTEGSKYKLFSIGGRDTPLVTEGVFKGFASIGIDEAGLQIELGESHDNMKGKIRIIPLHAILAIDILDAKVDDNKDDIKDTNHYYG